MFQYFFTYRTNIPKGIGFGLFSETHFFILFILLVFSVLFIKRYLKADDEGRRKSIKTLAIVMFISEFIRQFSLVLTGQYQWDALPLDLCAFGWMMMIIDAFSSNKMSREVLYSLSLPGALAALITPNWTIYPVLNYYEMQSFFIHTVIVGYTIMKLLSGEIVPKVKNLWWSVLFLAITLPIAMVANACLGTNFYFLNTASPGSPLEPLQHLLGNMYIFGLFALVFVAWGVLYFPWWWQERSHQIDKKIA